MNFVHGARAMLAGALVFAGVSTNSGGALAQSRQAQCDAYAYDVAQSRGQNRVKAGALIGGAAGAVIGGITGGGKGAAIGAGAGAAAGAAGGAASKKIKRSRVYQDAYADCMAGRVR